MMNDLNIAERIAQGKRESLREQEAVRAMAARERKKREAMRSKKKKRIKYRGYEICEKCVWLDANNFCLVPPGTCMKLNQKPPYRGTFGEDEGFD